MLTERSNDNQINHDSDCSLQHVFALLFLKTTSDLISCVERSALIINLGSSYLSVIAEYFRLRTMIYMKIKLNLKKFLQRAGLFIYIKKFKPIICVTKFV